MTEAGQAFPVALGLSQLDPLYHCATPEPPRRPCARWKCRFDGYVAHAIEADIVSRVDSVSVRRRLDSRTSARPPIQLRGCAVVVTDPTSHRRR